MMRHFLGVDVGGTNTRLLLMDDDGEFSGYRKVATADWARQADPLVALGRLIVGHCKDRQGAQVMLGLPGILSRDRSRVLSLPFIPALDAQPVAALLADALALPVRMDKDVNHLLWWDLQQLPALPQVAVGLYLGTGMGNSLWLNGDFYHGAHGAAGELGHIPWPGHQGECPCGKRGCVESLTSGHWLTGWARANAAQTPFERLFERHGEHPDLRRFVERLAQTIAIEMNVLDPQQLILGGGVIAMSGFPLARLEQAIRRHLRGPQPAQGLAISISRLTDETGSKGACLAARRHLQLSREYPQ
ncbi:allose kinase [Serratia marcescens]|uniref:allose kinase n=1 Tax=Serratia marcescens TaxID=615 RepID=UPI000D98C6DD|nr:allose kinase [Serratia marcescens]PYB18784.1 allose kinase [Serratia marcescens]